MTYPDSVKFLYALGNEIKTAKLGLDAMRILMAELGNPQDHIGQALAPRPAPADPSSQPPTSPQQASTEQASIVEQAFACRAASAAPPESIVGRASGPQPASGRLSPRIIHVAGTNGKGSTCAMLEAGLRAHGLTTGLYTSPHLIEPTERIAINGQPVSSSEFNEAFEIVHKAAQNLEAKGALEHHPTYFETVTAMAFVLFERHAVDIVVLETGLGGRLDATNIVHPELTVITPIDFDHEQYLGNTIEAIAGEKAGIIKPGVPVVCAAQRDEARFVIEARAEKLGAQFIDVRHWQVNDLELSMTGCHYVAEAEDHHPLTVDCPLAGMHQVDNSLTAAVALAHLGIPPTGIAQAHWPGRLECLSRDPLIIADGAHNPSGARALAAFIELLCLGRPVTLIYGTMRDKAVDEIAGQLFPLAERIIVSAPESQRALRPESLRESFPDQRIEVAPDLAAAIAQAKRELPANGVIFITGSLYLVGEARRLMGIHQACSQDQ